jgi:hypothetical protein
MGKYKFIESGILFGLILSIIFLLVECIKLFFFPSFMFSLWFNFAFWLGTILFSYVISRKEFLNFQYSNRQKLIFLFFFIQISAISVKAFEFYLHQYYDVNYSDRIAKILVDKLVEKDLSFEKEHHAIIDNKENDYQDLYDDTIKIYSSESLINSALLKFLFNLFIIGVLFASLNNISPIIEIDIIS